MCTVYFLLLGVIFCASFPLVLSFSTRILSHRYSALQLCSYLPPLWWSVQLSLSSISFVCSASFIPVEAQLLNFCPIGVKLLFVSPIVAQPFSFSLVLSLFLSVRLVLISVAEPEPYS
jgi:hypothetical protein